MNDMTTVMTREPEYAPPDFLEQPHDGMSVRGFYRVRLVNGDGEPGSELVGDSGWHHNLITNTGFLQYLVSGLGAIAGSLQVVAVALGSGGAPIATDTSLAGEVVKRASGANFLAATSSSSKAVTFTATFGSASSFVTNTQNISNIGLCAYTSAASGSIFSGNTYASSSCATNQSVNVTYTISFS